MSASVLVDMAKAGMLMSRWMSEKRTRAMRVGMEWRMAVQDTVVKSMTVHILSMSLLKMVYYIVDKSKWDWGGCS